ncbi:PAS domain S-box protein [Nocardia wallacei]|uniref:PAS domain S-box protein n=1 Tax=Nocardia wallacei TaxID=480035 RepID=UPI00245666BB|nr:PAS domain S-box protein [Nocardia wallacei]
MASQEVTRRWADALDGVVAPTLTRTQVEDLLADLCAQLLAVLRDDGDAGMVARSAATALVAANYKDSAAVARTVPIICRDMVEALCPERTGAEYERLRDRAVTVAAEFAAGFTAALRTRALTEQEATLTAALGAVEQAQAQRQLSEARFAAIFAGASVGIGTVDAATGTVLDVNAAMAEMLGVPAELIPGRSVAEVLGADNIGPAYAQFEQLLAGRIDRFRIETKTLRPDGTTAIIDLSMSAVRDARGEVRFLVGVSVDITERQALAAQLWHDAHHDNLTGLANRVLFFDRLAHAAPPIGLCYLDLDGFKEVNDEHGHTVGDRVLRAVAERLRAGGGGGGGRGVNTLGPRGGGPGGARPGRRPGAGARAGAAGQPDLGWRAVQQPDHLVEGRAGITGYAGAQQLTRPGGERQCLRRGRATGEHQHQRQRRDLRGGGHFGESPGSAAGFGEPRSRGGHLDVRGSDRDESPAQCVRGRKRPRQRRAECPHMWLGHRPVPHDQVIQAYSGLVGPRRSAHISQPLSGRVTVAAAPWKTLKERLSERGQHYGEVNAPAPGPVFDVIAVLNGVVDLSSYPRRNLALSSPPRLERRVLADNTATLFEPIVHLLNGVELLESQGWELVSVIERSVDSSSDRECCLVAFLRRR